MPAVSQSCGGETGYEEVVRLRGAAVTEVESNGTMKAYVEWIVCWEIYAIAKRYHHRAHRPSWPFSPMPPMCRLSYLKVVLQQHKSFEPSKFNASAGVVLAVINKTVGGVCAVVGNYILPWLYFQCRYCWGKGYSNSCGAVCDGTDGVVVKLNCVAFVPVR